MTHILYKSIYNIQLQKCLIFGFHLCICECLNVLVMSIFERNLLFALMIWWFAFFEKEKIKIIWLWENFLLFNIFLHKFRLSNSIGRQLLMCIEISKKFGCLFLKNHCNNTFTGRRIRALIRLKRDWLANVDVPASAGRCRATGSILSQLFKIRKHQATKTFWQSSKHSIYLCLINNNNLGLLLK